jgi:uncharacterized protein (DUF427 family)
VFEDKVCLDTYGELPSVGNTLKIFIDLKGKTMTGVQAPVPAIRDSEIELIPIQKRVRVFFNGEFMADSQNTILLRRNAYPSGYYFPARDVRREYLQETGREGKFPGAGKAKLLTVQVGPRQAANAAWQVSNPDPEAAELQGYITFKWTEMDRWLEEDEEIFVHPRDPYTRIDALQSSRHVRVEINGVTVAESTRPVVLFETGLRLRYYLPLMDVRLDLLEPSDLHTACPYKGTASYYSVRVGDELTRDIVWYYPFPYPEVGKIQNLLAFYDNKVNFFVDGEKLDQ